MQKRKRRRSDRAGRPAMRSPGRPPVAGREEQQRVGGEFVGIRHRSIFGSREPGVPRDVVAMA